MLKARRLEEGINLPQKIKNFDDESLKVQAKQSNDFTSRGPGGQIPYPRMLQLKSVVPFPRLNRIKLHNNITILCDQNIENFGTGKL